MNFNNAINLAQFLSHQPHTCASTIDVIQCDILLYTTAYNVTAYTLLTMTSIQPTSKWLH